MTGYQSKKKSAQDKLAQPVQEPMEDVMLYHDDGTRIVRIAAQRPWVGLTDEETKLLWTEHGYRSAMCKPFARAIEAKLKEKNT